MQDSHGRIRIPDPLSALIGKIAALYSPTTAIDPCCDDLGLLRECHVAKTRRALFRNHTSLQEASEITDGIKLDIGDITRLSLAEGFDLVVTWLPMENRSLRPIQPRQDVVVAERCLDLVDVNGVCLLIVPANFLAFPRFQEFRDRVLNHMSLDAVIEFPRQAIDRQLFYRLALLVIRNGPPHAQGTFLGEFGLHSSGEIVAALRDGTGNFFVKPDALRERWDRNYHDPRHRQTEAELAECETKRLEELSEIVRGNHKLRDHLQPSGKFLVLSRSHLLSDRITVSDRDRFVEHVESAWFEMCIVKPGDVVVSLISPVAYVYKADDPPVVIGTNYALIRSTISGYLAAYLNTPGGMATFEAQADRNARGATMQTLSLDDLRSIRIPLLPIEDLNSVGDAALSSATPSELDMLRQQLVQYKHKLEFAEAKVQSLQAEKASARFLEATLAKILAQQKEMNAKIDRIASMLKDMRDEIGDIKNSSRSDEEKLTQIYARLEAYSETAAADTRGLQVYVNVVKTWLDHWDVLDQLTQTFLPSAEQLYDLLEKQPDADFSPFVIQYCRAFENEILKKLFEGYHNTREMRIPALPAFLATDLQCDNTKKFAKRVRDDDRRYTLGEMSFIMCLLKSDGNTLAKSPLLQDFRKFVISYFDQRIAEKEFLAQIEHINSEFRCKAAHPYLMSKAAADDCMQRVRSTLGELLDFYRAEGSLQTGQ